MNQPAKGDRVTVTRTHSNGRTSTWIGIIGNTGPRGFYLTGTDPHGRSCETYLSSADELARYGVAQTISTQE